MMIDSGEWDEVNFFQLPLAHVLKVGGSAQIFFFYKDHQSREKGRVEHWNDLPD